MKNKTIGIIGTVAGLIISGAIIGNLFPKKESSIKERLNLRELEKNNKEIEKKFKALRLENDTSICFLNTKNNKKANALNITFYRQCRWDLYNDNDTISTLINQYLFTNFDGYNIGLSIDVSPLEVKMDDRFIENCVTGF